MHTNAFTLNRMHLVRPICSKCLIVKAWNNRSWAELLSQRCIRCNYKWPGAEDWEPIRSRLACQPKTNCLLALTAGFYLHNSNPRAKQSALCQHKITGRVYKRHMERTVREIPGQIHLPWLGENRLDRNQTLIRCKHLHRYTFCDSLLSQSPHFHRKVAF